MPLTDVAKPENLRKLPPDRPIVVFSNDGMSGNQVAGILRILGYEATNLSLGMTAWAVDNEDVAPGGFEVWEPDGVTLKDVIDLPTCWIDLWEKSWVFPVPPDYEPPTYAYIEEGEQELALEVEQAGQPEW